MMNMSDHQSQTDLDWLAYCYSAGELDAAEAEARAHQVAEQLVRWYNQQVGVSMLRYARRGKGRRLHILDTTHVEVP